MRILAAIVVCATITTAVLGQENDFEFGKHSLFETNLTIYQQDSMAVAVVLNEVGYAYIDLNESSDLIVEYHIKIKVLDQRGVAYGNVSIPLRKNEDKKDVINWVKASSYNIEEGKLVESKLEMNDVFIEDPTSYYELKKFAVPNVKAGSIIEYKFQLRTPFVFNFWPWEFQGDIPKIRSEFWAKYPANYVYSVSLKGYLELQKSESILINKCVVVSDSGYGQGTYADCTLLKFAMQNIPAFKEEEYMTAKSNFLSRLDFELSEIRYFTGGVNKITKSWKDVDQELKYHKEFGLQIKRGKEVASEVVDFMVASQPDSLSLAKSIYEHIKNWIQWNGSYGKYSEFGIKESYTSRKGNIGDINLNLIASLKYAGFSVSPVILSTRSNGLPREIFPVLSDFDYVIAKLVVGGKMYLLDASDDFVPFGIIPIRCINGKGRVLAEGGSYWLTLSPSEKKKTVTIQNFRVEEAGLIVGTIQNTYYDYEAIRQRKIRSDFQNVEAYQRHLESSVYPGAIIDEFSDQELSNITRPLTEKFTFKVESTALENLGNYLINPFLAVEKIVNPFRTEKRNFPVDFGVPIDETVIITIEFPDTLKVSSMPGKVALALPDNGGRYLYDVQNIGNKLTISSRLLINKSVYSPEEYHSLKELFARVIQSRHADIVLVNQ
jgi:hypothetical protein